MKRYLLIAAALLAGCGSSGGGNTKTVVQVQTVTAPQTQTTTLPDVHLPPPTEPAQTTEAPPSTPPGGTLSQARQTVSAEGYNVDNPGDYKRSAILRVLIGTRKGSGDGYAKRAFFFVGGRYLGTDTSDDSANIRVAAESPTRVTLAYALYGPDDALCCPGGTAIVRYEWNGSKLLPLDPIPPRSKRG
jgi:hypothetical protein